MTTHPLRKPQPPLSNDADAAAHHEIEPTGLEWHKRWTTTGPPARRRPALPSIVMADELAEVPHALPGPDADGA